jgi:hypothetical protein
MKLIIIIILGMFSFNSSTAGMADLIFKADFEVPNKRVFISGHSLMDNPYADYLQYIADNKSVDYNWNQQIGIGSPIRVRSSGDQMPDANLWTGYLRGKNRNTVDMNVISELANPTTLGVGELYDSLIITERHDILDTSMWELSNSLLRHFHNRALTGNPAAKTYLYHSWWNMDFNNIQEWIDHQALEVKAYECVAEKVNLTLENDSLPRAVENIPTALALANLVESILNDEVPGFIGTDIEKMDLLFNDNVHLNTEAIFFMAAVTYASLLGNSPEGITIPAEIATDTGIALLQIAWQSVSDYNASFSAPTMSQCRTFIEDQLCTSYFNIHDRPDQISFCQAWITDNNFLYNPFHWPDPNLITWPDPPN